jgi:phage tail sheath protein FI
MDILYNNQINPIRYAPGRGIVIWGQKTLLARPSSLDRLNVRLLLIVVEPALKEFLEDYLFEFNDAPTRSEITVKIEGYLENIRGRRGVFTYDVNCDETNNTPTVIDNNELICDVFLQPNKSAEIIPLRIILLSTGASTPQAI